MLVASYCRCCCSRVQPACCESLSAVEQVIFCHLLLEILLMPPAASHRCLCPCRRFMRLCIHRCLLLNPIHAFIALSVNPSIFVCPHSRLAPECMSRHNRAVGGHLWDQLGIVSNMCSGTRCEETLFGLVLNRQGRLTGYKSCRQGQ